jgi:hypothetical protein
MNSSYRPTMNYYGNTANCASGCPSITSSASSSSPARGSGRTQDSLNVFEWFLLSQKIGNGPFPEGAVSKLSSGLATQLDSLDDGTEFIHVYPNPVVSGNITLTVQNDALGKVLVTLMDPSGRVVQENVFIKNSALFMRQVMLPGGMKGVYLMKVQIQGKAPAVFKLLKE